MILAALFAVALVHTYTHPACGYSFQYPDGWEVVRSEDDQRPCEVRVSPVEGGGAALWIDGGRGGGDAASKASGFTVVDAAVKAWSGDPNLTEGSVVVFGREKKSSRAYEIAVGDLEGLRANDVALECEGAGEKGRLCPRDIAFLTNGKRWVSLDSYAKSEAFELALRTLAFPAPATCTYTHPQCGYSFKYLADWTVVDEDEPCAVRVVPPVDGRGDPVEVKVGEGGLYEGAEANAGNGAWESAEPFQAGKLHGYRAEAITSFVLLASDDRWVMITVEGDGQDGGAFDVIVESVAFAPTP
jgi:hypothetical protein